MATNIEILNNLNSPLYNERIPAADKANLADIAEAILSYQPLKNEVLTEVINKIAFTIIRGTSYESTFAQFRGEDVVYGDTIEEIEVMIPEGYDPRTVSPDPFAKVQPSVKALYHTLNFARQYEQTITDVEFRKAVKSANGLDSLVNAIIASMTDAMALDDDLCCIKVLSNRGVHGQLIFLGAATGTDATDAGALLRGLKRVGSSMKHASNKWNFVRALKQLPLNRQVIVMTSEWKDKIDLDVLAGVYNLNKVELAQRIIEVESFIDEPNAVAVIMDERALIFHKSLVDAGMIYNPKGVPYTNHFLNSWGVYSFSLFADSALFLFENSANITLTVQSDDDVPVSITSYVVKDPQGRIVDVASNKFNGGAGTYTCYAEGYDPEEFTVTEAMCTAGTGSITVEMTAEA